MGSGGCISDWSSDVCSSDRESKRVAVLQPGLEQVEPVGKGFFARLGSGFVVRGNGGGHPRRRTQPIARCLIDEYVEARIGPPLHRARQIGSASRRERVGKSVYIRVVAVQFKKKKHQK